MRNEELGWTCEVIDGVKVELIKKHTTADEARAMVASAIREGLVAPMTDDELAEIGENWTYAWKLTIDGQQYGDYLTLSEPIFDVVYEQLVAQAREVIKAKKP